ncbi:MAG TPA: pyridoxal-phosphate dependent enzyme, partial [Mycobacteriales bacterium]|nr:pyridoxal-phosphate dependent enzyme [Mycobacteriales bacterium]
MTSLIDRPSTSGFGSAAGLACRECGATYDLGPSHVCEMCFGPLEISYDDAAMLLVTRASIEAGPRTMWRYGGLLPAAPLVDLQVGMTRLVPAEKLAAELGMRSLWVKDDSGNPTHSFKDRVVAVAASAAKAM